MDASEGVAVADNLQTYLGSLKKQVQACKEDETVSDLGGQKTPVMYSGNREQFEYLEYGVPLKRTLCTLNRRLMYSDHNTSTGFDCMSALFLNAASAIQFVQCVVHERYPLQNNNL